MVDLKFYGVERERFTDEFAMYVSQGDVLRITRKLSRHFKFRCPVVNFRYNDDDHGLAKAGGWAVNLSKSPTLGLLLHELAHLHNYEKYSGNWGHNKKLMRTISRFAKYCRKKNYWKKD